MTRGLFSKRLNDDRHLNRLQKHLDDFEHELPALKERHAAREKEWVERERSTLQRQLSRMVTSPCAYSDDDLTLLGITREELERRYEEKAKGIGLAPPNGFTRMRPAASKRGERQ